MPLRGTNSRVENTPAAIFRDKVSPLFYMSAYRGAGCISSIGRRISGTGRSIRRSMFRDREAVAELYAGGPRQVDADPESGACCVVDLTVKHPLAQSTISHHLRVLADAGLVQHDRRGTYQYYRIDEAIWDAFRQHTASLQVCHGAGRTLPAGRIP